MAAIGVRSVPWPDTRRDDSGPWVVCRVQARVEFVVNGKTVTDLSQLDEDLELVTVFDVTDTKRASEILLGQARLDEYFPPAGRLPLLLCPCGDPGEGTLSVRLTAGGSSVAWDDWSWEHDSFPNEPRPDLPACHFPIEEYRAAVRAAGELSLQLQGQVSSVIRVRDQGNGLLRWLETRLRGELACQLDWLEIEVLTPPPDAADETFAQLISSLAALRNELSDAKQRRAFTPTQSHSENATTAAQAVLASPESYRLPQDTLFAVEWILDFLSKRHP